MTETAFNEIVTRSYQRLSSLQIDFLSVNTKYNNERTRRGTYYFELPLVHIDGETTKRIICQVLFNPAHRQHFIHYSLKNEDELVDAYIDQLLKEQKAERNQRFLRILDESVIKDETLTQIRQGIANAVKNMKFWNYQSGKAQYRIPELGTIYLRPLREE